MGIEIRAERNTHHADIFFLPRNVAHGGIDADVQDLGIQGRELFPPGIEFGDLRGSSRSPVERVKSDHRVLFAAIVAQANGDLGLSDDGWQDEIWSDVSNVQRHGFSLAPGICGSNSG